jgi:mRNA interferase RelE/StbE
MYRVRLSRQAQKDLDHLPDEIWQRMQGALAALQENPRRQGSAKLRGGGATYRVRIGDYRALYDVDDAERVVMVLRVQHRREAYRKW